MPPCPSHDLCLWVWVMEFPVGFRGKDPVGSLLPIRNKRFANYTAVMYSVKESTSIFYQISVTFNSDDRHEGNPLIFHWY